MLFFSNKKKYKSVSIIETLESDSYELKVLKDYTKKISLNIQNDMGKFSQKIEYEIFVFIYFLIDFHLVYKKRDIQNRKELLNSVTNLIGNISSENNINLLQLFNDRIKNYNFIFNKNNNTIDNNFFYMCENYQVQLLGKIFEKNEFSKYDGINKNTDDFEKIMSYVTEGKVLKAILNSKNDFFNLSYSLDGKNPEMVKQIIIKKIKQFNTDKRVKILLESYNRYTPENIIEMFNFNISDNYKIIEQSLYQINSTYRLFIKYLIAIPKSWGDKKYTDDDILKNCHKREIFHAVDCILDKEVLTNYFYMQYIIDRYINSETWDTQYDFIINRDEIEEYKNLLQKDKVINSVFKEMEEYPVRIMDDDCLHIGIFTTEKEGIYFKIIKIAPNKFYDVEYKILLKKGIFANLLI